MSCRYCCFGFRLCSHPCGFDISFFCVRCKLVIAFIVTVGISVVLVAILVVVIIVIVSIEL